MIRTLYRHRSGTIVLGLPDEQLLAATNDSQARLWIDISDPSSEEAKLVFEQAFNFHPLAIEDTLNDVHVPKLDNYDRYLFLVFHALSMGDERMDIHTTELDVFLGHNFLITTHAQPMDVIDQLWQEAHHQEQGLAAGPVFLLYELLDQQIDQYIPIIDRFELRLEDLGDVIFQRKHPKDDEILNDILTAKSSALRMRRILRPQRDIIRRLGWEEFAVIPPEAHIYFRDVFDHLARLTDLAESMRDLASSTIETHLALVNHRMNDVMKVLTVISTIFIPLGFITGVYGMNFAFMPELNFSWAYPLLWLFFLTIAGGMLYFFRRLNWL
ncbi:magnesium/cobalt transporter CorA [Chloroflexi bacterium TSY]|nr:magnesium/cobalt transporter CorA [Chloroflexi bacterium TSY]